MVKQYPYILKIHQEQEASFDQHTADWVQGATQWIEWSKCRDEISNAAILSQEDGKYYQYTAVIYCPKSMKMINKGTKIQVWNGEELRLEGEVKR